MSNKETSSINPKTNKATQENLSPKPFIDCIDDMKQIWQAYQQETWKWHPIRRGFFDNNDSPQDRCGMNAYNY
jgi:hypothetical protein